MRVGSMTRDQISAFDLTDIRSVYECYSSLELEFCPSDRSQDNRHCGLATWHAPSNFNLEFGVLSGIGSSDRWANLAAQKAT